MKAFPKLNEKQPSYQTGMDLRDWFAGLAMEGIVYEGVSPEQAANAAYQMADAMMKAREKKYEDNQQV